MVHKSRLREHLNNTLLIYRAGLRPSLCAAWPNLWRRARCRESKIRAQWHKENTCTNSSHIRKHLTFVQKPIQFLGWNGRTAVLILFSPLFFISFAFFHFRPLKANASQCMIKHVEQWRKSRGSNLRDGNGGEGWKFVAQWRIGLNLTDYALNSPVHLGPGDPAYNV